MITEEHNSHLVQDMRWIIKEIEKEIARSDSNKIQFSIQTIPIKKSSPSPREQYVALWRLGSTHGLYKFAGPVTPKVDPQIGLQTFHIEVDKEKLTELKHRFTNKKPVATKDHNSKRGESQLNKSFEECKRDLERQFEFQSFAKNEDDIFFRWVADYIKFIDESPILSKLVQDRIESQAIKDHAKLDKLGAMTQGEVDNAALQLRQIIQRKKIDLSESLASAISEYNGYRIGRINSSSHEALEQHGAVTAILRALLDGGHTEIVKKFAKLSSSELAEQPFIIEKYIFAPSTDALEDELRYLKRKRRDTVWGSWRELYLIFLVIHKNREAVQELQNEKREMKILDFSIAYNDLQKVVDTDHTSNTGPSNSLFRKSDYLLHVNRVHNVLISALNQKISFEQRGQMSNGTNEYVRFDDSKNKATIKLKGKEPIEFSGFRAGLIRCLSNTTDWLDYADIRQCEGCNGATSKKIRQSAMKINDRIRKDTGVYPIIDFKPKQDNSNTPLKLKWNM